MKKTIALALGLTFLAGIIVPLSDAARSRRGPLSFMKAEKRFSDRVGPFHYRTRKPSVRGTSDPHYRGSTRRGQNVAVYKKQDFLKRKAKEIAFYISHPKGFRLINDSLTWSGGSMRLEKADSSIEVTAYPIRCDQDTTASRSDCLRSHARDFETALQADYPGMSVQTKKRRYLEIPDSVVNAELQEAWYLQLHNRLEKAASLTFLDPVHGFVWNIEFKSPNNRRGLLNNEGYVNKVIASLFQETVPSSRLRQRQRVDMKRYENPKRREVRKTVFRAQKQRTDQVIRANYVPFEMRVPRGFKKVSDSLQYNEGILQIRDTKGNVINIIATNDVCPGNTQSRDSQERKNIRNCIREKGKSFIQPVLNLEGVLVLHDENIAVSNSLDSRTFQETGHLFMASYDRNRIGQFTFRTPDNHHIWRIEMEASERRGNIMSDAQTLHRIIRSPMFFHTVEY